MLERCENLVAGRTCASATGRWLPTVNPYTGKPWAEVPRCGPDDLRRRVEDMRIAQEEVFGLVLSIVPFEDDDHAVEIANDSLYGLAAGVWTTDIRRAITMADRVRAGTVWVNTYRAVSFLAPFGGYKKSGIGRENGHAAIDE